MMPARVYHARLVELNSLLAEADTEDQLRSTNAKLHKVLTNALTAHPSYDYTQPLMATAKTKFPTVALDGKPAPKRPLSRLALHVSPDSDVARGRRVWPPVAPNPCGIARPYTAAVEAVGGLITPTQYVYK